MWVCVSISIVFAHLGTHFQNLGLNMGTYAWVQYFQQFGGNMGIHLDFWVAHPYQRQGQAPPWNVWSLTKSQFIVCGYEMHTSQ